MKYFVLLLAVFSTSLVWQSSAEHRLGATLAGGALLPSKGADGHGCSRKATISEKECTARRWGVFGSTACNFCPKGQYDKRTTVDNRCVAHVTNCKVEGPQKQLKRKQKEMKQKVERDENLAKECHKLSNSGSEESKAKCSKRQECLMEETKKYFGLVNGFTCKFRYATELAAILGPLDEVTKQLDALGEIVDKQQAERAASQAIHIASDALYAFNHPHAEYNSNN